MNLKKIIFCIFLVAYQICSFASEGPIFRVREARNCSFIKNGIVHNENEKLELSLNDSIFFRNNAVVKLEDRSKKRNDILRNLSFEKIFGKYCLRDIINEYKTSSYIEDLFKKELFTSKSFATTAQGEKGENKDSLMLVSNIKCKIEDFYMEDRVNSFSDFNISNGIVAKYNEKENILVIKNNLNTGLYIDILYQTNGKITSCLSNGKDFVSKLWINKGKSMKLIIEVPEKAFIIGSEIALPYNYIMRINLDNFLIKELESEIFLQMIKIGRNITR